MARLRLAESRMEARRRTRRRCVLMLAGGEWTPASRHSTFIPTSAPSAFSGLPGCNVQTCKLLWMFVDCIGFFVGNFIAFLMYVKIRHQSSDMSPDRNACDPDRNKHSYRVRACSLIHLGHYSCTSTRPAVLFLSSYMRSLVTRITNYFSDETRYFYRNVYTDPDNIIRWWKREKVGQLVSITSGWGGG